MDDSIPVFEPLRLPEQIKALVVDDDVFQQALVSDVLLDLNIVDVAVASSGDSAVKLLEFATPPFNLLVIDLVALGEGLVPFLCQLHGGRLVRRGSCWCQTRLPGSAAEWS